MTRLESPHNGAASFAKRKGAPAAEVVLYADDVTVLLRGKELPLLYRKAQRVLDNLSRWETANSAKVSLEKTTVTVYAPGRAPLPTERRPQLRISKATPTRRSARRGS